MAATADYTSFENVPRRLLYTRERTSNYVVVGAVQSAHDPATDLGDEGNPPFDYVNFSAAFGRVDAPMMQAWSAAAPFRKVPAKGDDPGSYPKRDTVVQEQMDYMRGLKRGCEGTPTGDCTNTNESLTHKKFYDVKFAGNAQTLEENYGHPENPDPLYYPMTADYGAYNQPPTELGDEYPDFRARFIPLAGGLDHQELDYFGNVASDADPNPFKRYGFSEILFGSTLISGMESVEDSEKFRYLFRH
jgi:hypothetical protein